MMELVIAVLVVAVVAAAGLCVRLGFVLAHRTSELEAERKLIEAQKRHYEDVLARSETQFKNIAQKVLEERSAKLKDEGESGMRTIADGIAKDIRSFRERLEIINKDAAERGGKLDERIAGLVLQTNAVSAQANNLADAIRGDAQVTGAWGELGLKRVLDLSGFSESTDYTYQETFREEASGRKSKRTDFVIKMTGGRALVIDSKNTVESIQELHGTEDAATKKRLLSDILLSVRGHVDEIAAADYQKSVPGAFSTVLMYIPIEEVYLLAMKSSISVGGQSESLREYAARKNVVFVNSTSVVPIVKIVEMLWEMERSEANREELTRAAEELLDRANKFVRDFQEVGSALESARGRFEAAKGLLIDAPGGQSIAKAAGKLVKLGVKPHKRGGKPYELVDAIKEES